MKSMLLAVSLLMVGSLSHASESCQELAQLRAQTTVVAKSEYSCTLGIKKVELYLPSQDCPLQLDEILAKGIYVTAAGHTCNVAADGIINNILTKDAYGDIVVSE